MRLALFLLIAASTFGQTEYWPLAEGKRWELKSPNVPQPMAFEVESASGGEYRVRWENPWVKAMFYFRPVGNKILLTKLDMGAGTADMPEGTVYFDFDQRENGRWSSAAGTMTVTSTNRTVRTPAGEYRNCIQIKAKGSNGGDTFWTFARGVGPVQFGEGKGAFVLASAPATGGSSAPIVDSKPPQKQQKPGKVLIGIDANPSPTEGFSASALQSSFKRAADSGMNFTKIHPKWDEVEKSPGRFTFGDFEAHSKRASDRGVPIYLGIRTIDTQKRSMPRAYSSWKWDDPRMKEKLTALLEAMASKFRGDVRWVAIGNEVDQYFKNHRGEIGQYATLMREITPVIHRLWPNAKVTVNFTWEAAKEMRDYRPILDTMEIASFTYYPLNPDFTVKSVDQVEGHLDSLIRAADGRKVILQEIGYPSGTANGSSDQQQADFVERAIRAAKSRSNSIVGMNFLWMSDLPDSVVEEFAKYYKLPNAEKFKSYLATMGLFDKNGKPKPAWEAWRREAR